MAKSAFVFCLVLVAASVSAIPFPTDETGLNAALSSIAHSVVVVSEDEPHHNVSSTVQADEPAPVKLESANVLPSLALIAITPEAHNVLAETEKLVYENETDSKGVIKITVVTPTTVHDEDDSGEQSTTEASEGTTLAGEDTTQVTDSETEVTTDITTTGVTSHSTTVSHELTVLGIDQADKQKEEEIKKTIKEVEAMPVILTAGV
ncbi:AGAP006603-PA-like protein [Anopheles sinensis]|uniref:AGAP006603-PA-like protein n=1 Tax=Anopheles sinensis TaxID=74873 RepID=A0A084WGI5_ANOSI|nr:AGAP006603-PA-like protein [Anopheles sinensis]